MTPIPYAAIQDIPLVDDEAVRERVADLLVGACGRELWFMPLDERQCQLRMLVPVDVSPRPTERQAARFGALLAEIASGSGSREMIVAFERGGGETVGQGDRAWFRLLAAVFREAGIRMRGPVLVHDHGARWVAPDDYA